MMQELHILSTAGFPPPPSPIPSDPLRLPAAPSVVVVSDHGEPAFTTPSGVAAPPGALVEPMANARKQLQLFVRFPVDSMPRVNGEPVPHLAVLSPDDVVQWAPGIGFRVALFNRPEIGPPPEEALGRPCPVCRVPLVATTTCVACQCGVVLHCEPDRPDALQCAQMARECPVCHRPVVLTEGYVNPPADED